MTRRVTALIAILLAVVLLAACGSDKTAAQVEAFRYRTSVSLEGSPSDFSVTQSGEIVLPDRERAVQKVEIASARREGERLAIGKREWVRGDLPWMDFALSPLRYLGKNAASREGLADLKFSNEVINGVATRRYDLDADHLRQLVANDRLTNPDGPLSATLWLATDLGIPIRLEVLAGSNDGTKLRMTLEVFDVNDQNIKITVPKTALMRVDPLARGLS